jgi:hypothetical protein
VPALPKYARDGESHHQSPGNQAGRPVCEGGRLGNPSEAAAAKFIEGGSAPVRVAPAPSGPKRTPAMIRFDAELLARVDRAARRRGVSRSAWVAFTLSKALDEEEQA